MKFKKDRLYLKLDKYKENDPNIVVYFSNQIENSIYKDSFDFLDKNLANFNYSGIPMYLKQTGSLQIICFKCNANLSSALLLDWPTNILDISDLKAYWNQMQKNLHGMVLSGMVLQTNHIESYYEN